MKRNKFRALFVWVTLAIAICGSIVGCSSNRKSPNEVSNSGAIAEEDFADAAIAEDSSQAPVVFMPLNTPPQFIGHAGFVRNKNHANAAAIGHANAAAIGIALKARRIRLGPPSHR